MSTARATETLYARDVWSSQKDQGTSQSILRGTGRNKLSLLTLYTYWYITISMAVIKISGFKCERCEHEWIPRNNKEEPLVCPKCKSPYWNKPRKNRKQVWL